ncbi:MAG: phosphoenolpyruvate carboxylase [Nitrososphaerota archaeon]|nr:phosphoenolpyruvate carboxylase [Candidatus Bathyarchaeota archaeon]MDW8062418.1 phosphoenolpyruvate carboxylase [Nitrososphaerota archaeon]
MPQVDRKIPATMSTQHPDNVFTPPWLRGTDILDGDDEVYEAYYVFRKLNVDEQMWDWEGKDADIHVVRKLLLIDRDFFAENRLGEEFFLTYRLPNPFVETIERKSFIECLETIPRFYDYVNTIYKMDIPPVFEVILPLTTSCKDILTVYEAYRRLIASRDSIKLLDDTLLSDIIGSTKPEAVEVIPLLEDMGSILRLDSIVGEYLAKVKHRYLRVFIARSDPALNYGLIPATILTKVALAKIYRLSEKYSVEIYPIIGGGSPPFRGYISPQNIENALEEYRGYKTVTVQSSFKYDNPINIVAEAVERIGTALRRDESSYLEDLTDYVEANMDAILSALGKLIGRYQREVVELAKLVNEVASLVPARRARRLHIGLYGYSRSVGSVKLPRAIPYVSALYSLGMPPEFIGLSSLTELNEREWCIVRDLYVKIGVDLSYAARHLNMENIELLRGHSGYVSNHALDMYMEDLSEAEALGIKLGARSLEDKLYSNTVNSFLAAFLLGRKDAEDYLIKAAMIRRFLG